MVLAVKDHYAGKVKMIESGDALLLDQQHVETVIPAVGGCVLIVNGERRGEKGILKELNVKKFSGNIELDSGDCIDVPYEHFCKMHVK